MCFTIFYEKQIKLQKFMLISFHDFFLILLYYFVLNVKYIVIYRICFLCSKEVKFFICVGKTIYTSRPFHQGFVL